MLGIRAALRGRLKGIAATGAALRDLVGNLAVGYSNQPVTNNTSSSSGTTAPARPLTFAATYDIAPAQSAASQDAIRAAIEAVPNGPSPTSHNRIRFPAGLTYNQTHRIMIKDRQNITIDGNGCTFISNFNGDSPDHASTEGAADNHPNWAILRGTYIALINITTRGDFTAYEGQTRSLPAIGTGDTEFTEKQAGFGLYGAQYVWINDCTSTRHWSDGACTGPAHYMDDFHVGAHDYTKHLYIKNHTVYHTGRTSWAPTSGEDIWIEDSSSEDAWYGAIDSETDGPTQVLNDHYYLRNTFNGFNMYGINIPVAGVLGNSDNYQIIGNTFLTGTDNCAATITIGAWPGNPEIFRDVIISDNTIRYRSLGIVLDHVQGATVSNNTFIQLAPPLGYTWTGYCGWDFEVRQTNSSNVVIS